MLKNAEFNDSWQQDVWKNVEDLTKLTRGKDPWVDEKKGQIYGMYVGRISDAITAYKLTQARSLMDYAKRYTDDQTELDKQAKLLAQAQEKLKIRQKLQQEKEKQQQIAAQQKREEIQQQKQEAKKSVEIFDLALGNVNSQLKCQGRLNMPNLESAISRLKELDAERYQKLEGRIINALGDCIAQMGKAFPARAEEAKKHALRIFKNNAYLAGIEIKPRDPCDISLAGLGARGKRTICKDTLKGKKNGPELVVIPASSKLAAFAIGKYEVSIEELNAYCKDSGACPEIRNKDKELPASNMSLSLAKNYLRWLSRQSGQKYRLPTRNEWVYAAKSRRKKLDANRNCKLTSRGIVKGQELVKANIGAQNSWGLVNYVGNVQEWVYDKGHKLVAVGGSFQQSMDSCDITTVQNHTGSADIATGFRVLREISRS